VGIADAEREQRSCNRRKENNRTEKKAVRKPFFNRHKEQKTGLAKKEGKRGKGRERKETRVLKSRVERHILLVVL
jgi:hypothetical protein